MGAGKRKGNKPAVIGRQVIRVVIRKDMFITGGGSCELPSLFIVYMA